MKTFNGTWPRQSSYQVHDFEIGGGNFWGFKGLDFTPILNQESR